MPSRTRSRSGNTLPAAAGAALRRIDAGARPEAARYLGAGYAYAAYRIPSASGDWVIRVPKRTDGAWGADRLGDLEREVRFFHRLAGYDFGVTVLRDASLLRDARGRTVAAAHRYVPGRALAGGGAPRGAARAALARDLGRFLSRLHAVPLTAAREAGLETANLASATYVPLTRQALPYLGAATARWLTGMTDAFLAGGGTTKAPRRVIHADISGHHLLLDGRGRLSGVIDFGDILIGDPALDFAGVLNHLTWRDLERVWAHYEGPLDADTERRVRYYIAVSPLFQVVYGADGVGPQERAAGVRRLAARAATARRRGDPA